MNVIKVLLKKLKKEDILLEELLAAVVAICGIFAAADFKEMLYACKKEKRISTE